MANEIRASGTLSFAKGDARDSLSGSIAGDADFYTKAIQLVGTSEENLDLGEVATITFCAFRNLDATNFVELGSATGAYSVKLAAGEFSGPIAWDGAGIFAKADTDPVAVEYMIVGT